MSGKPILTRAQSLSLAGDRNLSVIAGAGTGKTHVLSERFLDILARYRTQDWKGGAVACPPAGLVAMTFTRKAAGEMQERIARELGKQVRAARAAGDAEAFAYWTRMRRRLGDARITTIHGLCTDIVLDHALLLGLDPESRVLDAPEQQVLAEEALDETLRVPPEEVRSDLVGLIASSGMGEVRKALLAILSDHVFAEAWTKAMAEIDVDAYLGLVTRNVAPCDPDTARSRLERICAEVAPVLDRPVRPVGDKANAFLDACQTLMEIDPDAEESEVLLAYCGFLEKFCKGDGGVYGEGGRSAAYVLGKKADWEAAGGSHVGSDLYVALRKVVVQDAEAYRGIPNERDRLLLRRMKALAGTLEAAQQRYDRTKKRRRALDYSDLERHALRLLEGPFGILDEVRSRIRHLMVDEFQDTNEVQWRLIRLLASDTPGPDPEPVWLEDDGPAREAALDDDGFLSAAEMFGIDAPDDAETGGPAGPDADEVPLARIGGSSGGVARFDDLLHANEEGLELSEDRLFIVGDAKQSIYSFRGADVSVYHESRRALKAANRSHDTPDRPLTRHDGTLTSPESEDEAVGEIRLDENFRSLPHLVRFTNRLFDHILAPSGAPQPYDAEPGPLEPRRPPLDGESGQVHLIAVPDDAERFQVPPAECERLARHTPKEHAYRRLAAHLRANVDDGSLRIQDPDDKTVRPARYEDVAILLPARTHLKSLERALADHEVPYVVTGGRGFWDRQEIWDHLNLLTFLADPYKDTALVGLLRSPFFAWTDDAVVSLALDEAGRSLWQRLERAAHAEGPWCAPDGFVGLPPREVHRLLDDARAAAGTMPTHRILRRLHEATAYPAALSAEEHPAQAHANVQKLLRFIREREARQGIHLPRLARDIRRHIDDGTDEAEADIPDDTPGVRILTIHAAKGLEYPVVYLPDLDREFPKDNLGKANGYNKGVLFGTPLVTTRMPGEDGEPDDPLLHKLLKEEAKGRIRAEQARLLYVAVTRARDHLFLVSTTPRLFPDRADKGQPPERAAAGHFIDWVEDAAGIDAETYTKAYEAPDHRSTVKVGETPLLVDVAPPALETPPVAPGPRPSAEGATASPRPSAEGATASDPPGPTDAPALEAPRIQRFRPPLVVHPSAVETYLECPARFRHRHLESLPDLRLRGTALTKPDRGRLLGSAVHRVLESTRDDEPIPKTVEARLASLARENGFPARRFVEDVLAHVDNARGALQENDSVPPIKELAFDHAWVEGVRTRGVIDRLFPFEAGWRILDTKADRPAADAGSHGHGTGYDAQVALYTRAVAEASGKDAEGILLYTSTGEAVPVAPDEVIDALRERLEATRDLDPVPAEERTEHLEDLWPRSPADSAICDGCGFHRRYGGPCPGPDVTGEEAQAAIASGRGSATPSAFDRSTGA